MIQASSRSILICSVSSSRFNSYPPQASTLAKPDTLPRKYCKLVAPVRKIALAMPVSTSSIFLPFNPPNPDSNDSEMLATDVHDHCRANAASTSPTIDLLSPNLSKTSFNTVGSNAKISHDDCEGRPRTPMSSVSPTSSPIPRIFSKTSFATTWMYWKWEISACVLLLAVLGVMIGTILPHENQPLPRWPFKVSINALLSIYTLMFKSAVAFVVTSCVGQLQWAWFASDGRPLFDMVLYDNSGRGPWGSLTMLWTKRLRQPLAGLGAIILVLSLATDPFVQQLIRSFDCKVAVGREGATLPRTNRFDAFSDDIDGIIAAQSLKSLSDIGFSPSAFPVPWDCSTGNCTFPEVYGTLGVCSTCEDLSAELIVNTTDTHDSHQCAYEVIHSLLPHGDGKYSMLPHEDGNYYYDDSDDGFHFYHDSDGMNTTFHVSPGCTGLSSAILAIMGLWKPHEDIASDVHVRILIGKTPLSDEKRLITTGQEITGCGTTRPTDSWACRGYGAASCTLRPCVREYSASIQAGHLTEHLVSQSPDVKWGSTRDDTGNYYYGLMDIHCMSAQEKTFLEDWGYHWNDATRWIPFEGDLNKPSISDFFGANISRLEWSETIGDLVDHRCLHLIDGGFLSNVDLPGPGVITNGFKGALRGEGRIERDYGTVVSEFNGEPQILLKMYNFGSVDFERIQSTFSNVSDSLTTFIRTHGNASYSQPITGQVQHYATCLGIQWPWITLPVTLAVFTIAFLALVMESTGRLKTPIWKASPLPWILGGASNLKGRECDISSDSQESPNGSSSSDLATMEDTSREVIVTISQGAASKVEMIHLRDHNFQSADIAQR